MVDPRLYEILASGNRLPMMLPPIFNDPAVVKFPPFTLPLANMSSVNMSPCTSNPSLTNINVDDPLDILSTSKLYPLISPFTSKSSLIIMDVESSEEIRLITRLPALISPVVLIVFDPKLPKKAATFELP